MFGNGVRGAAELERALAQLGKDIATKIGQTATRAAAKPAVEALKAAAPNGPRFNGQTVNGRPHIKIRDGLKIKKGKSKSPTATTVLVHTGMAFHALFIDRGTIHIAARPFFHGAMVSSHGASIAAMGKALEKGIARAARRAGIPTP